MIRDTCVQISSSIHHSTTSLLSRHSWCLVHDHPSLAVQGPKLDSDEEAAWKRRPRPRRRDSEGRRKEGVAAYPPPARAPVPPPLPARKAMRSSSSLSRRCAPDAVSRIQSESPGSSGCASTAALETPTAARMTSGPPPDWAD